MRQIVDVDTKKMVWKVEYGSFYNPAGEIFVDCVGKVTAALTAADLGLPRTYKCTPVDRSTLPDGVVIYPGKFNK